MIKDRKTKAGNKLEIAWFSSERYAFDFSVEYKNGWRQYDCNQDAWYYGVWYNPETLQTLTYAEGDIHLVTCETWDKFKEEMAIMNEFHGAPPPMAVSGDRLGINGKVQGNVTAIYDEKARLDPDEKQPEQREPTPILTIMKIFAGSQRE